LTFGFLTSHFAGGAQRRRNGRPKRRKFNTGAFILPNPNLFWTKLTASLRSAQNRRSGGAGRKGVWGKWIPAPPSLFRRRNFSHFASRNALPRSVAIFSPIHTRATGLLPLLS